MDRLLLCGDSTFPARGPEEGVRPVSVHRALMPSAPNPTFKSLADPARELAVLGSRRQRPLGGGGGWGGLGLPRKSKLRVDRKIFSN